jgi:hypothetical protein
VHYHKGKKKLYVTKRKLVFKKGILVVVGDTGPAEESDLKDLLPEKKKGGNRASGNLLPDHHSAQGRIAAYHTEGGERGGAALVADGMHASSLGVPVAARPRPTARFPGPSPSERLS